VDTDVGLGQGYGVIATVTAENDSGGSLDLCS